MKLKLFILGTVVVMTGFGLSAFGQTSNLHGNFNSGTTPRLAANSVPETSTLALLGGGGALASLFVFRRRKY